MLVRLAVANLTKTYLRAADLTGADLGGANVTGAYVRGAKGLQINYSGRFGCVVLSAGAPVTV